MTEDEAKRKWCHLLMPTVLNAALECDPKSTSMETAEELTETGMCVGSDCMAWRWDVVLWDGVPETQDTGDCGLKR